MSNSPSFRLVIGISGWSGSGKTSLAIALADQLSCSRKSFGNFVRKEAARRGIPNDREALQEFGEMLLGEMGEKRFVQKAILSDETNPIEIIDGIRHVAVWEFIQTLTETSLLIFLNLDEQTRIKRLQARDEISPQVARRIMNHPMEKNIVKCADIADLLLAEMPLGQMVTLVVDHTRR